MAEITNTENLELPQTDEYESFVLSAGELIKNGQYGEAIKKLDDNKEAIRFGFSVEPASRALILKHTPDEEKLTDYANLIASNSWFRSESKTFEMAGVAIFPPNSGRSTEIPQKLLHDVALVHLEEWLHGLQYLKSSNLTNFNDKEHDIAVYMDKKGIPMTDNFLNRYGRKEALEKKTEI